MNGIELSVVIPCLDEADTIAACIERAKEGIAKCGLPGEIIVADNGSTDDSRELSREHGARVCHIQSRGYGSALMGGVQAAQGPYIIMGDADGSYDFAEMPKFVTKLREGYDLVQGCRLPAGGGNIEPGAMPLLHRWLGNPFLSCLARLWFRVPIHDVYCGFRGFTKELYRRLDQRCTGMEFATEMVVKSTMLGAKIAEVPITLHPDGRTTHPPHVRTIRDGWRTLRFFMLYSPRWLFVVPGLFLIAAGLIGYALSLPRCTILGATLDVHTLLLSSVLIIMGYQCVLFGMLATVFAVAEHLVPASPRLRRFFSTIKLETGLLVSAVVLIIGIGLIGIVFREWWRLNFGGLDYARTMRLVVPGVTLSVLGFQSIMGSLFASILGLSRK